MRSSWDWRDAPEGPPSRQAPANSATGSQNFPPIRWSWENMVSEARLEDIRRSVMNIHRLALSHIVAADHATMIELVQEIKAEEAALDEKLAEYEPFISQEDRPVYRALLEDYDAFKHALIDLVCASADSRTQCFRMIRRAAHTRNTLMIRVTALVMRETI